MNVLKKLKQAVSRTAVAMSLAIATVLSTSSAQAVIDTAAISTELDAMPGYMVVVGSALILAAATAIGFKWIKGAIFS